MAREFLLERDAVDALVMPVLRYQSGVPEHDLNSMPYAAEDVQLTNLTIKEDLVKHQVTSIDCSL